jgi:hypothetical protein
VRVIRRIAGRALTVCRRLAEGYKAGRKRSTPAARASPPLSPAEKLRLAFELFESGADTKRQNSRRRFPDLDNDEIEAKVKA